MLRATGIDVKMVFFIELSQRFCAHEAADIKKKLGASYFRLRKLVIEEVMKISAQDARELVALADLVV